MSSESILIFSKRNQGTSIISYIPNSPSVNLVLVPLYDTSEFPLNSFQIFSVLENTKINHIRTDDTINDINSNSYILAVALSTKIDIFESKNNFAKLYSININNNELKYSLAN